MSSKTFLAFAAFCSIASAASGATLLARMATDTYTGINMPPLHSSANFAFGIFNDIENKNAWQIGTLTAADVGRTISVTPATAGDYPDFDWPLLDYRFARKGEIVWVGFGRPVELVTGFAGLQQYQIFNGFHAPTFESEAFVPSLDGYSFSGYRLDRLDFTLHSLGFRQQGAFYYIDAHFEVQMFGDVVPEPAAGSLMFAGALISFAAPRVRRRRR